MSNTLLMFDYRDL
jgi:hypothetical protein